MTHEDTPRVRAAIAAWKAVARQMDVGGFSPPMSMDPDKNPNTSDVLAYRDALRDHILGQVGQQREKKAQELYAENLKLEFQKRGLKEW